MNPETPFTTIGDEPVEARIVAWVLGEASAFEASELERLCGEKPELMIFKRRMLALHGLLTEAENPQVDDAWKLSLEKRKPVEEILGEKAPVRLDTVKENRIRHSGRRAFLAIAACLILTVIVAGLMAPAGIQKVRKKAELTEARSDALQRQVAIVDSAPRMRRLETTLPKELIEGTPRPKNVSNLEVPADGPAGSSTWAARESGAVAEMAPQARVNPQLAAKPAAPSSSMAKVTAANTAPETSLPMPEVAVTAPSLDFGDGADSGTGWAGGGLAPAAGEPAPAITAGNRSGDAIVDKKIIDGILNESGGVEDEGVSFAGKMAQQEGEAPVAGDIPVLGALFSNDQKRNFSEESLYAQNDELAGANTYSGGTTVSGGALGFGRSGGVAGTAPAPAAASMPDQSVHTDANGPVGAVAGQTQPARPVITEEVRYKNGESDKPPAPGSADADYRDTSTAVAKGKESGKAGTEHEIHSGYKSEYLFRGRELGEDGVPHVTTRSGLSADEAVAEAQRLRKVGKYDEARDTLKDVLSRAPGNQQAGDELAMLDDPLRTNPALTYEHTQNVDGVRRGLDQAEGNFNLGKFDDAKREYEDVLRKDPYNQAARRGMEKIAAAKSDYYRAAYDHTRAELLAEVDKACELSVPEEAKEIDGFINYGAPIAGNEKDLSIPDDAAALAKAVRDQEDKVEERRKVLSTIVRTKGIIYKGSDESKDQTREEAIKRGLDAQDYADAKREFEKDQELLQQMKLKLMAASIKAKPEPPKVDLAKLMEEIAASEEPYSTFSLNISDASFQIAQAAMAKGEQPDPAGIKVEQFYNAVDYGDPAPAAGEPVAVSIEQAAHPVIPGRNLVRIALKTAAAGRSAAQPLRLTLLVDQSGSMVRADRRAAMDKALAGLSELLTENDLVTVIGFSRTPRLLADGMTGDNAAKLAALVNQAASEGGTNLEEAIKLGEQMADRRKLAGAQNRIVLFTDGAANLGNADPQRLAEKVQQLRQKSIAFDIAGIAADGLNDELLAELARNGNGRYYVVGKGAEEDFAKQLAGAFRPAAENVKVQVRFNPERVGSYKLIGFEKDRLKTEDFRNDKVDAAELAAEEAGVAIYQVEPKPEGNGELGEVSVRFRDTASGGMVERTWTIPHDAAAPAIDRATPSMQLAALAMLAGEKLKGGPLGEAIDFQQLAVPQANVKQSYGNNARVGDVLRMVDMLK